MGEQRINIAVAGVGNCASSLVQAVASEHEAPSTGKTPGVPHPRIGPYKVGDIRFVAAFDVDRRKVGRDLAEATRAEPNCTTRYHDVRPLGVRVDAGPLGDGIRGRLADVVEIDEATAQGSVEAVTARLRETRAEVLVCYLPAGASVAVRSYSRAAVAAGVCFVNATPELVANDPDMAALFAQAGVPLLGDDVKSQFGATALHTALLELCESRGAIIDKTYQFNVGGNTDFLNMLSDDRAASKRASKLRALKAAGVDASDSGAGPSGFAAVLKDHKVAYIRVEGRLILDMPFSLEVRLEVEDSPNSAGVIVDAVRLARCARDAGLGGVIEDVCPHLFKSATRPLTESQARRAFEEALKRFSEPPRDTPD